jgi:hypothetical protein
MSDLTVESQTELTGVTPGGLDRDYHIAEAPQPVFIGPDLFAFVISERKHVGRFINAAISAIQPSHRAVTDEGDSQSSVRAANSIERHPRQPSDQVSINRAQPLAIDDLDLSLSRSPALPLSVRG